MAEEYAGILNLLDPTNATLAADIDNKIVVVKTAVKNSFPSVTGAVTKTHAEINALPDAGDNETITGDWVFSGDPTFSSAPVFSGVPEFNGGPRFSGLPFKGLCAAAIASDGSVSSYINRSAITCVRNGPGRYTVTHNMSSMSALTTAIADNNGNNDMRSAYVRSKTANTVDVYTNDNGGSARDCGFTFIGIYT